MLNQDYSAIISDMLKRLETLEKENKELKATIERHESSVSFDNMDWDNSTLMREWGICERTAANYRRRGLAYYKRGGRVFYTPEAREAFENKSTI